MRQLRILLVLLGLIAVAPFASAQSGKILKVLPQYLDLEGRTSISPSLYDRDAYQAQLRRAPKNRSGLAFNINWKARSIDPSKLKVRVEMRGVIDDKVQRETIEQPLGKPSIFRSWTLIKVTGKPYQELGNLIAWRVTLWNGEQQLSEQRSFLW